MRCSLMQTNHQTRIYPAEPFVSLTREHSHYQASNSVDGWEEGVAGRGFLEKGRQ